MTNKLGCVIVVALVALPLFSQTPPPAEDLINPDRPGIADSSTTLAKGSWQIETGLERDDTAQGGGTERDLTTPSLLRYGLTPAIELRVEGAGWKRAAITDSTGQSHESGWTPVSAGLKIHMMDGDDASHRPSLGLIARLFVPSGSGSFRESQASGDVRLAADMGFGEKWAINPNIGIASVDDGVTRFTAALAAMTVLYNFSKTVNVFVDGGLQTPESKGGETSLLLDLGTAWIIGRDTQLDASMGWGAHGRSVPNVFVAAGVSRRF